MPAATGLDPLTRAVQEFNSWRFYDCHETLEDVWLDAGGKSADAVLANFYQGIIKVAAGFHHVLRDNHRGAVLLLTDALRLLVPYRPQTLGVDVEALADATRRCLERIESLPPDHLREFDRSLIPTIQLQAGEDEP